MKEEQENNQKTEQNNKEAEGKGKKKELTRTQEIEKSIRKMCLIHLSYQEADNSLFLTVLILYMKY